MTPEPRDFPAFHHSAPNIQLPPNAHPKSTIQQPFIQPPPCTTHLYSCAFYHPITLQPPPISTFYCHPPSIIQHLSHPQSTFSHHPITIHSLSTIHPPPSLQPPAIATTHHPTQSSHQVYHASVHSPPTPTIYQMSLLH